MLVYQLLSILLFITTAKSKPIQDVDQLGHHYKRLSDNSDDKLRYVETIEDNKLSKVEEPPTTLDPLPKIELLSTPLIDPKLDEEIEDENSSSEEEETPIIQPTNATDLTSNPNYDQPSQQQILSVEEHENQMAFDEKHEILAKKPMPQIIRTANTVPTILPQTASAVKPTQPEPPTTPFDPELAKISEGKKQLNEHSKVEDSKQTNDQSLHNAEFLNHQSREEIDQNFDDKTRDNQVGGIGYGQTQQIMPELHGKPPIAPIPTTQQPPVDETTPKPTNSVIGDIFRGLLCSRGDCSGAFVSTTPANRRELKQLNIIRRVRHDKGVIEVECECSLSN